MDRVRGGDPVRSHGPPPRRAASSTRVVVAALVALAAAACGRAAAPAPVPDGFAAVDGTAFRIVHPDGWRVAGAGTGRVQAAGEPAAGGIAPAITARLDERFDGDFATAVDGVLALADLQQPGRAVVATSDPAVPGARRARLVEATWVAEGDGGDAVPMRQWDLFTVDGADRLVYVAVNGPRDALPAELARILLAGVARTTS